MRLSVLLIQLVVGSLVGAVFLRGAAKWVEKVELPFLPAYGTAFLASLASLAIGFVYGLVFGRRAHSDFPPDATAFLTIPVGVVVLSAIVSARHRIPFARAFLVSLVMLVLACVMVAVVLGTVAVVVFVNR